MKFDAGHPQVQEAIERALREDVGAGDLTTTLCVEAERRARGRFIARQSMVVAGVELLPEVFRQLGGVSRLELCVVSGAFAEPGSVLAVVEGAARTLLTGERVALNFLQRLSGIATLARRYVQAVPGTRTRILDTRKTTPGLRRLEKMAAAAGGVTNHRMGLFDAILIKNNHIAAAGGVRQAVERARSANLPVEVEVRNRAEVDEALSAGASRLLLDNYTPEEARAEIAYIAGRASIEISGGITLDNIGAYAAAGADFISSGAITHSATAVDINFRIELL